MQAVTNVLVTQPITLSWTQPASDARAGCITGYIISWPEGETTTTGTSTSVNVTTLDSFPFCQALILTVTPNTPFGRLSVGTDSSSDVFIEHPGIPEAICHIINYVL